MCLIKLIYKVKSRRMIKAVLCMAFTWPIHSDNAGLGRYYKYVAVRQVYSVSDPDYDYQWVSVR